MKLEYFINELVKNQKEFSRNVTSEIKDINHSINDLRIFIASSDRKP
jgi:ABC-type nickel/cobalt efflux system permease component RcnA